VHAFMDGARRLEAPLFVCVCFFLVEGTLEERGHNIVGTCWSEAREDLFGGYLR
jgi:hypothetical protein